ILEVRAMQDEELERVVEGAAPRGVERVELVVFAKAPDAEGQGGEDQRRQQRPVDAALHFRPRGAAVLGHGASRLGWDVILGGRTRETAGAVDRGGPTIPPGGTCPLRDRVPRDDNGGSACCRFERRRGDPAGSALLLISLVAALALVSLVVAVLALVVPVLALVVLSGDLGDQELVVPEGRLDLDDRAV